MWSILVITSSIFQTAIAIFLLNGVRTGADIDKHLRAMLLILLVHLSVKFFLLAVLKDQFLYAQVPSGFSLAYGPLLFVVARNILGKPLRPKAIFYQFLPFLILSIIYLSIVVAGAMGSISRAVISMYASWYQWLLLPSLYGYPIYVILMLRRNGSSESRLIVHIGYSLLVGVSAGLLLLTLHLTVIHIPGFDLRMVPYFCYSAIPVLILRYRLRKSEEKRLEQPVENASTVGILATRQEAVIGEHLLHEALDKRYEKSGMDSAKLDEYEAALAAFMKKTRIYLDADLSLEGLATRMKMPKHHLTQLLNDRVMKNFYTYINEYRIAESVTRIKNHPEEVNILSLAFDCGFNSRSSFNNYFKR